MRVVGEGGKGELYSRKAAREARCPIGGLNRKRQRTGQRYYVHNIQHHFIALSILNASLPAPDDLITLTQRRPPSKMVGARDSVAISDVIFYSYAHSMITRTR